MLADKYADPVSIIASVSQQHWSRPKVGSMLRGQAGCRALRPLWARAGPASRSHRPPHVSCWWDLLATGHGLPLVASHASGVL